MKKENLFKLWAYDAESKMWKNGKEQIPDKCLKMIEEIQKKTEVARTELYNYILTVEDPYYRVLLTCRCIDRKTWKEVAQIMGGTPDSHRMALQRFIDEQQQQR